MWRKQRRVYQDHMKYIHNNIVKPFRVKILRYAKRIRYMHDLAKYLPPPSMKGESAEAANWTVRNQEFTVSENRLVIKDGLPSSMQDDLEDHQEDYLSLTHKIGVTSCPQLRPKIIGKGQQPRSTILPLIEQPIYLTATSLPGFRVRTRQGLVSCAPKREPRKSGISTMVPRAIACFARSQECLSRSICRIVPRTVRACVPTGPSRMEWGDIWEVGLIL